MNMLKPRCFSLFLIYQMDMSFTREIFVEHNGKMFSTELHFSHVGEQKYSFRNKEFDSGTEAFPYFQLIMEAKKRYLSYLNRTQ